MESITKPQILDEAVWVSFSANFLGKGINLSILPFAIGK